MQKRVLTVLLASMLVAGVMSSCGKKPTVSGVEQGSNIDDVTKSGYPVVSKTVKLTALAYGEPGSGEWENFPVLQDIEKQTNVDVTWQTISGDGATEKLNVILASKDLPDMIFSGLNTNQIIDNAEKGIVRSMNSLIEGGYAPNLSELLEKYDNLKKAITLPDGNIYALASVQADEDPVMTTTLNINKTWANKLGIDPNSIKTIEDFENFLTRCINEDPNGNGKKDELGFCFEPSSPYHVWNGDADFMGAWGIMTDWDPVMVKDGAIAFTPTLSEYKDYLKWFKEMYTTGLMDKEIFTHDHNQYMAKIDGGQVAAYLTNGASTTAQVEYVSILPLEGPGGAKWGSQDFSLDKNRGLITTACEYPETAMRFMDSFYDPENSIRLDKGVALQKADNGKYDILSLESGKSSQAPGAYVAKNVSKEVIDKYYSKSEQDLLSDALKEAYSPYLLEPLPLMNFTPEESKRLSTLSTDISKLVYEQKAKWCTGQGDIDAEWDNYVASLNKLGLEEYMKIYNTAYDRYKNS